MRTPFSEVYKLFLSLITDYNLLNLDDESLEENLQKWLVMAVSDFSGVSDKDLSTLDFETGHFNDELGIDEISILARGMEINYLSTFAKDESLLKSHLVSRDYRELSPANQLRSLTNLLSQSIDEYEKYRIRYDYKTGLRKRLNDVKKKWVYYLSKWFNPCCF